MIYICIPTHNEQQTVGVVLWKLRQVLTDFPRDYQLLVADDASTDKTIEVLEPYTRVLPLTVISSRQRQGYAASLEMLLREAVRRSEYPKRDVIVTLQADFSEEPDDVVALIKRLEAGADVAVGIKVRSGAEPRLRRLGRSLSRFFVRRQKWPEGVVTPFDGYRAYRLHAVKRAIEERNGRRLLSYDGWAGHAELLRAVLPHARRVEALDVEDRPDRLQRPRRERPLTAAWQVRAMVAGQQPPALIPVEELDRTAATASRSRERTTLAGLAAAAGAGRARRSGGDPARTRSRHGRGERGERTRDRGARDETGARERSRARADGAERQDGQRRRERRRPEAGAETSQESRSRERQGPERRQRQRAGTPRPAEGAAAEAGDAAALQGVAPDAAAEALELIAQAGEGGESAAPRKRRRRRRSRGGAGRSADGGGAAEAASTAEAAGGDTDAGAGDDHGPGEAPEGDAASSPERKRRRRGGRGRRRSRRDGEAGGEASAQAGPGGGEAAAGEEGAVPRSVAEGRAADMPSGQTAAGGAGTGGAPTGGAAGAGREAHGEAS